MTTEDQRYNSQAIAGCDFHSIKRVDKFHHQFHTSPDYLDNPFSKLASSLAFLWAISEAISEFEGYTQILI